MDSMLGEGSGVLACSAILFNLCFNLNFYHTLPQKATVFLIIFKNYCIAWHKSSRIDDIPQKWIPVVFLCRTLKIYVHLTPIKKQTEAYA
jgi:hypothetical protein